MLSFPGSPRKQDESGVYYYYYYYFICPPTIPDRSDTQTKINRSVGNDQVFICFSFELPCIFFFLSGAGERERQTNTCRARSHTYSVPQKLRFLPLVPISLLLSVLQPTGINNTPEST